MPSPENDLGPKRANAPSPIAAPLTTEEQTMAALYPHQPLLQGIELSRCDPRSGVAAPGRAAPAGAEAPAGGCLGISTISPHGCPPADAPAEAAFELTAPPEKHFRRSQRRTIYALLNAHAKLELPSTGTPALSRAERYRLQSAARVAIPGHRTSHCLFTAEGAGVGVQYSEARQRASYSGLITCGRVWTCPVCAAKISEGRRLELAAAVEKHLAAGGGVYLITRTFPHTIEDRLADLRASLKAAEDCYKGEAWRRAKRHFGIVATIRNLENLLGENGWHLHIHELIFTKAPLLDDLTEGKDANALLPAAFADYTKVHLLPASRLGLRRLIAKQWTRACTKAGLLAPSWLRGVDVSDCQSPRAMAAYVGKWGLDHEVTKSHQKKGKRGSMSPFDLLRVIAHSDDKMAVAIARRLFAEYAEAMHGARQLVTACDEDYAHLFEQESDEALAEKEDDDRAVLALLSLEAWGYIRNKHRAQLLEAVEASPVAATIRDYFATRFPAFTGDPFQSLASPRPDDDDEEDYEAPLDDARWVAGGSDDCPF